MQSDIGIRVPDRSHLVRDRDAAHHHMVAGTERVEGAMMGEVMVVSPMPLGRGSSRQQGERHAEDEKSDEPLRVHSLPSGTIRAWSPYAPSGSRRQGDRGWCR